MSKNPTSNNNIVALLLRPQFIVFSLSVIFSQIAGNMLSIVLIVVVYKLTHSNFAVSILVMSFLLPQIFISFLGGIIADAKNKRKILLFGNLARVFILILFFFAKDTLALIYILMLANAIITQFYIPAEAPIIPHLVKKDQLLSANAIFGVSLFGSILVGYVFAGPAMRFFGNNGVFLFMSALFGVAYLCIQSMPNVSPSIKKLRTEKTFILNIIRLYNLVWDEFSEVMKILKEKKNVTVSLVFLALSQVIVLVLATIIPDYAQKTLLIPAEDISLIIFAPAALGMLVASVVIGSRFTKKSSEEKIINIGIILSSIVLYLFALIDFQHYFNLIYLTLIITFIAGVANSCIFIPTQTIIQRYVSPKSLSKVFGLLYLAVALFAFAPIILAGVFADVLGVRYVLLGIGTLLSALAVFKITVLKNKLV